MDDILKTIASVAPTLAGSLFGPLGALAATVAGKVLLGKDTSTPQEVVDTVAASIGNPDTIIKLKQIEADLKKHEQDLDIQFVQSNAADRASARTMAIQGDKLTPRILAISVVVAFVGLNFLFWKYAPPDASRDFLMRAMGTLDALVGMAFTFYFGGSLTEATRGMNEAASSQAALPSGRGERGN